MPPLLRSSAFGLVAGVLLSAMRAPKGLDWTQLQAVDGWTAALFRAGALCAIALFADPRRPAFRRGVRALSMLLAVWAGHAAHGLLLVSRFEPESRAGFALLLVTLSALLWFLAGPVRREEPERADEAWPALGGAERVGWALAGIGAAIALETLAHQVRLFGIGVPEDDTVIGSVFLLTVLVGALCFGRLFARPGWERAVAAIGVAAACAATLHGMGFLARLKMDPLDMHLKGFGMDSSSIGQWNATAVLAGGAFVAAGFVLGTALFALRHPARLGTLLAGAALGLLLRPPLQDALTHPMALPDEYATPWVWLLAFTGTCAASVGALLAVGTGERGVRRWGACLVVLAAPGAAALVRPVIWTFSPWYVAEVHPVLAMPSSAGLVTVEPVPDGTLIVTVDRERVTPTFDEVTIDERRIAWAWMLLDEETRERGPRLLVVGQMTPGRAQMLQRLRPARLDRTAPWFEALEAVDDILFDGGDASAAGMIVSPGDARRAVDDGAYDLVLALPSHGPILPPRSASYIPWGTVEAPVLASLDVPEGTLGVAWLDAGGPLVERDLSGEVMIAMDSFRFPSLGVIRGDRDLSHADAPLLFEGGDARGHVDVAARLTFMARDRNLLFFAPLFERLAAAAEGTANEELARGLALHFAAQERSSPFESLAQAVEVDEDALRAFHAAIAGRSELDAFTRHLWEDIARLLTEKRMPDLVLTYVESVAEAYAPWPVLDRALGTAYRELLEPADALRFLHRAQEELPYDVPLHQECADLALEVGEPERAAAYLREALEVQPSRFDLRRSLAIALAEAGDPAGEALLQELLAEEPEDEVLLDHLKEGPAGPGAAPADPLAPPGD